jgi:hypothetical protein
VSSDIAVDQESTFRLRQCCVNGVPELGNDGCVKRPALQVHPRDVSPANTLGLPLAPLPQNNQLGTQIPDDSRHSSAPSPLYHRTVGRHPSTLAANARPTASARLQGLEDCHRRVGEAAEDALLSSYQASREES